MTGQHVLITGGTAGIGYTTALSLAILGADILITSRSQRGCRMGIERIQEGLNEYNSAFGLEQNQWGKVNCLKLELEDADSIVKFVSNVKMIDVLILNAGYLGPFKYAQNPSNVSAPLMVDHLGHFLLTSLLLDSNKVHKPGRIILVSSGAMTMATEEELNNFLESKSYEEANRNISYLKQDEMKSYAAGKLANVLYMKELNERFENLLEKNIWERRFPITVNVAVPTITVPTKMSTRMNAFETWKQEAEQSGRVRWGTPAEGAMSSVYLAAEPTISHMSGKIMGGCQKFGDQIVPNFVSKTHQCNVWRKSLELITLEQRLEERKDVGQILLQDCFVAQ
eukprot:TRINITY_DN13939_c0_g1_i1.p2 TRINITY_DN13939_c0_g1~~TRINITY_DN13939_c0_g1_i1.p2  ORF type:complete len:349 (-),score=47.54 TRINITY_DN13939_c0_g1_i1:335-1351(-)